MLKQKIEQNIKKLRSHNSFIDTRFRVHSQNSAFSQKMTNFKNSQKIDILIKFCFLCNAWQE